MTRLDFDAVIAPLSRDAFLDRYWHQDWLHQQGSRERFAGLLDWKSLSRLLEQHQLAPPRLRLMAQGEQVDPALYRQSGSARLDGGALASRLAKGATLVLDRIEQIIPAIGDLAEDAAEILGARVTANLYAATHASSGLDLHWDTQDVLILQLAGRKQWRIYPPSREATVHDDFNEPEAPRGDPVWSGALEEGDILYLPRGWWHAAEATDGPTLHLTVTIVSPCGADFLAWISDELAPTLPFRKDLPHASKDDDLRQYFAALAARLGEACSGDAADHFRAIWLARRPARLQVSLPLPPPARLTDPDTRIRLRGIRTLAARMRLDDRDFQFKAAGQVWRCSAQLAPTLLRLGDTHHVCWADLVEGLAEAAPRRAELARLLAAMAVAGAVEICASS